MGFKRCGFSSSSGKAPGKKLLFFLFEESIAIYVPRLFNANPDPSTQLHQCSG